EVVVDVDVLAEVHDVVRADDGATVAVVRAATTTATLAVFGLVALHHHGFGAIAFGLQHLHAIPIGVVVVGIVAVVLRPDRSCQQQHHKEGEETAGDAPDAALTALLSHLGILMKHANALQVLTAPV